MEKNVSWKYILSETKRVGLNYNKNYKINKQRGVIIKTPYKNLETPGHR